MCVKAGSGFALDCIKSLPEFSYVPEGFELDIARELYYRQVSLDHTVYMENGSEKKADRLKLNLFFDPVRRSAELKKIDISQMGAVQELNSRKWKIIRPCLKA